MTLRKDEYMIKGDSIIIKKGTLERLRNYYQNFANNRKSIMVQMFYFGKEDIMADLLGLFEPLEE